MTSPTTVVTGTRAKWGVSDCGQLMGTDTEAGLASVEPEGIYEHLAIGVLEEGYTLVYKTAPAGPDQVKYDVYGSTSGIQCVSNHICRNDNHEFVKSTESKTDDDLITIRQTFIVSKNATQLSFGWRSPIVAGRNPSTSPIFSSRDTPISMSIPEAAPAGPLFKRIGTKLATRSSVTISTVMLPRANELTSSIWWQCRAIWFWTTHSSESSGPSSTTREPTLVRSPQARKLMPTAFCNGMPIDFWQGRCCA